MAQRASEMGWVDLFWSHGLAGGCGALCSAVQPALCCLLVLLLLPLDRAEVNPCELDGVRYEALLQGNNMAIGVREAGGP